MPQAEIKQRGHAVSTNFERVLNFLNSTDKMSELYKTKNVPEELKNFLESHPEEWFTNEQLADRLC